MSVNLDGLDLNSDVVSVEQNNDVYGIDILESNARTSVSITETLEESPAGVGRVDVHSVERVGDDIEVFGEVKESEEIFDGASESLTREGVGGGSVSEGVERENSFVGKEIGMESQMRSVDSGSDTNMANLSILDFNVVESNGGFVDGGGGGVFVESKMAKNSDILSKEDQNVAAYVSGAINVDEIAKLTMEVETEVDTDENKVMGASDSVAGYYKHRVMGVSMSEAGDYKHNVGVSNSEEGDDKRNAGAGNMISLVDLNSRISEGGMGGLADNEACCVNGSSLNGNKDIVNNIEKEKIKPDDLRSDLYCNGIRTEKEGEFHASDLVWGKVRSHPWWPGQIFDSSDSSEKAKKHYKKDSFLISYFGDQSFAWNEASQIKPFRMHFSQMEKQSSSDAICRAVDCALDEVSRRVEFGLACSCLSEDVYAKIKTQIVVNAGIREESSRRDGGDDFSRVDSFKPLKLVQYLKELAESSYSGTDRLDFFISRAQLSAFNRWKRYYQLPKFNMLDMALVSEETHNSDQVFEDAVLCSEDDGQILPGKEKSVIYNKPSRKRNGISGDVARPGKKVKRMSDFMLRSGSSLPKDENESEKKSVRKSVSSSSGKKRKVSDTTYDDLGVKKRKSLSSSGTIKPFLRIGDAILKVASQKAVGENEMLSQLCMVAREPMKGHSFLIPIVSFFSDFRNFFCLENSKSRKPKKSTGKLSGEETGKKQCNSEATETFEFEGMEDSYWTDMIIQSNPEEQVLFEPVTPDEKSKPFIEPEGALESTPKFDKYEQENSPTALILNFTDLDSVPTETILNKIFNRYGPINESETEVLRKSKRAKVVFKRRSDAETAFSSAGKFSIFGPSLVSYRLNYSPTPRKSPPSETKQRRKDAI